MSKLAASYLIFNLLSAVEACNGLKAHARIVAMKAAVIPIAIMIAAEHLFASFAKINAAPWLRLE